MSFLSFHFLGIVVAIGLIFIDILYQYIFGNIQRIYKPNVVKGLMIISLMSWLGVILIIFMYIHVFMGWLISKYGEDIKNIL